MLLIADAGKLQVFFDRLNCCVAVLEMHFALSMRKMVLQHWSGSELVEVDKFCYLVTYISLGICMLDNVSSPVLTAVDIYRLESSVASIRHPIIDHR